jgi:hypothetical protein
MMNVSGQQAAERLRILARPAAASLVRKKSNAVKMGKNSIRLWRWTRIG